MKNLKIFQEKNRWIVIGLGILLPAISFFMKKLNFVFGNNGSLLGKISYILAVCFVVILVSAFKNSKDYRKIIKLLLLHYVSVFFVTIISPKLLTLYSQFPTGSASYQVPAHPCLWWYNPLVFGSCVLGWAIALATMIWVVALICKQGLRWKLLLVLPYVFVLCLGVQIHFGLAYSVLVRGSGYVNEYNSSKGRIK